MAMKLQSGDISATPNMKYTCAPNPEMVVNADPTELSPLSPFSMFMVGYSDCANEALRYLTEDESLPLDHPFVQGLQHHLDQQKSIIDIQHTIQQGMNLNAREGWRGDEFTEPESDHSGSTMSSDSDSTEDYNDDTTQVISETQEQNDFLNEEDEEENPFSYAAQSNLEKSTLIASLAAELCSLLQEESDAHAIDSDSEEYDGSYTPSIGQ